MSMTGQLSFQLDLVITTAEGTRALCELSGIVRTVIKLVAKDDEAIALTAVKFLSDFGRVSPVAARQMLAVESNLSVLKRVMEKNSVVRYRVYEVILLCVALRSVILLGPRQVNSYLLVRCIFFADCISSRLPHHCHKAFYWNIFVESVTCF